MNTRSHILLFNPDQWRSDVMGHLGNPAALTPNLDRFVETEGVSFRNAFCQNTVCTPSRCSFMTGWYPHVRGHRTMFHMLHPEWNEPNLLKVLKDNGYFIWWGGKNDLTPGQDGFEQYCNLKFRPSKEDYERWGLTPREGTHGGKMEWRGTSGGDNYYSFYKGKLDKKDEELYCDNDWANVLGALDFIREYDGDEPLFIYLPLGFPHPPYCVEEPWFSAIDRERLPARIPAPESWDGKPSLLKGIYERQNLQDWTEDCWTGLRATYYGMCARLDHQFGLVLDALKQTGMYDDTAIFLFSDHGDFTGDYGLVEKTQNTFEDCLSRVPLIVKPPKEVPVKPGVRDALVELVDFPATVYELTRIEADYDHFGHSLLPIVAGDTEKHRDATFCEGGRLYGEEQAMERESVASTVPKGLYWPRVGLQITDEQPYHSKATMCRTQDFKYVKRLYEQDELYDLKNDPNEVHNVVNDPAYASILAELKERLLTWYMQTCDIVPRKTDKR